MTDTPEVAPSSAKLHQTLAEDLRDQTADALHDENCACGWGIGDCRSNYRDRDNYERDADAVLEVVAPLLAAKDQELERVGENFARAAGRASKLAAERDALSALLRGMARRASAWHRLTLDSSRAELELRGDVLVAGSAIGRWRERFFEMVRERDDARAEVDKLRVDLALAQRDRRDAREQRDHLRRDVRRQVGPALAAAAARTAWQGRLRGEAERRAAGWKAIAWKRKAKLEQARARVAELEAERAQLIAPYVDDEHQGGSWPDVWHAQQVQIDRLRAEDERDLGNPLAPPN